MIHAGRAARQHAQKIIAFLSRESLHSFRLPIGGALLVALLTIALYLPSAGFSFVNYDDNLHLHDNPAMQHPDLQSIAQFWSAPYERLYIPMAYTAWSLLRIFEQQIHPDEPGVFHPKIYHTVNILLHSCNSALVYLLLCAANTHPAGALLGVLLFAFHPVQVESVAWVSEMRGLLAAFFSFLAMLLALRTARVNEMHQGGRFLKQAIALLVPSLLFVAALLSKPGTIATPIILVLLGFTISDAARKNLLRTATLWLCLTVPVILATLQLQPTSLCQAPTPLYLRPLVMMDTYGFYISKILVPIDCAIDYGRRPDLLFRLPDSSPMILLGLLFGIAFLLLWRKGKHLLPGIAVFAVTILPVSGITPFIHQGISTVADRYLYIPLFGIAMVVAAIIRTTRPLPIRMFVIALFCALFLLSRGFLTVWKNDITLFSAALKNNPRSPVAVNNLAMAYLVRYQFTTSEGLFRKALSIAPGNAKSYSGLARIAAIQNRTDKAIDLIDTALLYDPENGGYLWMRGLLLLDRQDTAHALMTLEQARKGHHAPPAVEELIRSLQIDK